MNEENTKIPVWYWIVTSILLLWNIMGIMSFYYHIFITDEALAELPIEEAALYGQYPMWTAVAFAIAVFGGTLGTLGLMLKKKWSKPVLFISLVGIIVQMTHSLFITDSMEVYGPGAAIMPSMVILVAIYLVWLSNYAIKKNWLS